MRTILLVTIVALCVNGCAAYNTVVKIPRAATDIDVALVRAQKPSPKARSWWDVLDAISAATDWPGAAVGIAKALTGAVTEFTGIWYDKAIVVKTQTNIVGFTLVKTYKMDEAGNPVATVDVILKTVPEDKPCAESSSTLPQAWSLPPSP